MLTNKWLCGLIFMLGMAWGIPAERSTDSQSEKSGESFEWSWPFSSKHPSVESPQEPSSSWEKWRGIWDPVGSKAISPETRRRELCYDGDRVLGTQEDNTFVHLLTLLSGNVEKSRAIRALFMGSTDACKSASRSIDEAILRAKLLGISGMVNDRLWFDANTNNPALYRYMPVAYELEFCTQMGAPLLDEAAMSYIRERACAFRDVLRSGVYKIEAGIADGWDWFLAWVKSFWAQQAFA